MELFILVIIGIVAFFFPRTVLVIIAWNVLSCGILGFIGLVLLTVFAALFDFSLLCDYASFTDSE